MINLYEGKLVDLGDGYDKIWIMEDTIIGFQIPHRTNGIAISNVTEWSLPIFHIFYGKYGPLV